MDAETMRDLDSGAWATINPFTCPCGGSGWLLSDFDTWHRCPFHSEGAVGTHEDDPRDFSGGHRVEMARKAYKMFYTRAAQCDVSLTPDRFLAECNEAITVKRTILSEKLLNKNSVRDWVDAAEALTAEYEADANEDAALRQGFSCALEMNLAIEAAREAAYR